jgi:hypothetical protein
MFPQFELVLQLVTLAALLAGILFGILEVRRVSKSRAERAALEVFDITVQREVMDALTLILDLPKDVDPERIRSSAELRRASELLMNLFEYWGIMVYYRVAPLRTLDLLVGGVVRGSWDRLHRFVEWERESTGIPVRAEWFQWLADRLNQYPQPEKKVGAHVAFADWKP